MAYTLPVPAQIKTLWPVQFGAVPDATIQAWIDIAATNIDTSWLETDYTYAIELLAAHFMTQNGIGTGAQAEQAAAGMSGYQTVKSGQLTLTRGATSQDGGSGVPAEYAGTWYGTQFYWLARRNKPPMSVAQGPMVWPNQFYAY